MRQCKQRRTEKANRDIYRERYVYIKLAKNGIKVLDFMDVERDSKQLDNKHMKRSGGKGQGEGIKNDENKYIYITYRAPSVFYRWDNQPQDI